jgi:hypothetical protein
MTGARSVLHPVHGVQTRRESFLEPSEMRTKLEFKEEFAAGLVDSVDQTLVMIDNHFSSSLSKS